MTDNSGAYFANVFCFVSSLTQGVVECVADDRLPDDADPAQIGRLLKAGAVRFQADESVVAEVAPAEAELPTPRKATKRTTRKE